MTWYMMGRFTAVMIWHKHVNLCVLLQVYDGRLAISRCYPFCVKAGSSPLCCFPLSYPLGIYCHQFTPRRNLRCYPLGAMLMLSSLLVLMMMAMRCASLMFSSQIFPCRSLSRRSFFSLTTKCGYSGGGPASIRGRALRTCRRHYVCVDVTLSVKGMTTLVQGIGSV